MGIIPSGRHAVLDGADAIVFERTFAAPIDDVWAAITESGRLARWIGHYTGDPGGRLRDAHDERRRRADAA